MRYVQVNVLGGKTSGDDSFTRTLRGLCVDAAGRLFAVGDSEVKVFGEDGRLLRRWSTELPGYSIAVSPENEVYVGGLHTVEKYDGDGKRSKVWQEQEHLGLVTAIGFSGEHVLLADATHRCIHRCTRDFTIQGTIGKENNTQGFLVPNGHLDFAVDRQGIIHSANPGKYRIERYQASGELLGHFGRFGTHNVEDFPGCCNPTNVALTKQGQVVVTEKAPARAKVYDAAGKMLAMIGPDAFDQNCKNMDVAVDARGRIYIADMARLRIGVFASEASAPTTAPAGTPSHGAARP